MAVRLLVPITVLQNHNQYNILQAGHNYNIDVQAIERELFVLQWPNALQVRNLSDKTAASGSEPKLPLVRVKADYSGFSTIILQLFGHKYIGKVANPNDILVFSGSTQKHQK
ncbi:hypothetical protein ABZP36_020714 [Zizania latifolia]